MLCASLLAIVIDNTIVNVALPTLVRELDADVSELQWVVDAYTLVFAALLLLAGALGDRYGRRRTLLAGLAVFGAASGLAAFAGGVDGLIAARAVMGAGAACIMPATLSLLISVFTDPRERALAIGIWAATAGLGVALGPVVGGVLLDHFWWGSIFIVNVPLTVVAIVAGPALVPESRDPVRRRIDWPGAALSGVGLLALVWAIIEAPSEGWTSAPVLAGGAVAAVALGAFVAWQRRAAEPLLDVRLFRDARFTAASTHRHGAVLRALRVPLPGDAVPAVRARLLALGGRRARPALRRGDDRVRAAFGGARRALRHQGRRHDGHAAVLRRPRRRGDDRRPTGYGRLAVALVLMGAGMGSRALRRPSPSWARCRPTRANIGSAVNDTTRELGGALGVAIVGSVMSSLYAAQLVPTKTFPCRR